MKFKIQANADIDLLTKDEVKDVLVGWMAEIARGVKFRSFSASGTGAGGGAVYTIDGAATANLGPQAGFTWAVMRLYVSGAGVTAGTDLFSVFANAADPSRLVVSGLTRGKEWGSGGFVLNGNDRIVVQGVATGTAGGAVVIAGQAIEVPQQLAYRLVA